MMVVVLAAAVVLAVVANAIVYVIVTGPFGEPLLMCSDCSATPPELSAMDIHEPILFSTVFGVGAVVVYAIISALSARPLRVFAVVATVVLVVSIALPTLMPSPPIQWSAKLTLMAVHVVGYAVILGTVWLGHKRGWLTSRVVRAKPDPYHDHCVAPIASCESFWFHRHRSLQAGLDGSCGAHRSGRPG